MIERYLKDKYDIYGMYTSDVHRLKLCGPQVILSTGELKELEELKMDSDVVALRALRSVPRCAMQFMT